jgi:hypothetical protein
LSATIANVNRTKKQKAYEAKQFMPQWGRARQQPRGPLDGHEMLAKIKQVNRQLGGGEKA